MTAAKGVLRRRLLAARAARPAGSGSDAARTRRLLALPEVAAADCVAGYVSLPGEPDTASLLTALTDRGVRVLLPAVRPDRSLTFRGYDGRLVPGALGTSEPPSDSAGLPLAAAQVVVVPALAVDRHGRRLGRGGGSYDRALPLAAPAALVVALLHDDEVLDAVPVEPHDRPVGAVVTPRRVLRFPAF